MKQATVTAQAKIDVGPHGITLTFSGLDTDLAKLMESASGFTVQPIEHHSFDTSDVEIKSNKVIKFVEPEGEQTT